MNNISLRLKATYRKVSIFVDITFTREREREREWWRENADKQALKTASVCVWK